MIFGSHLPTYSCYAPIGNIFFKMRRRGENFPENGFEAWGGYMNAKMAKLEEQFCDKADKEQIQVSNIFGGVSIYVNGYTIPSSDELKTIMLKHGGIYHTYQRKDDYIIASNLPDTKVRNMNLTKVVKPEWISDSVAANRLLNYKDYLLYKNCRSQPSLQFKKNVNKICESENKPKTDCNTNNKPKPPLDEIEDMQTTSLECVNKNASINNEINVKSDQVAKTAADPNFISEFYSNSRLHHISQLGACFKQYINDLRENSNFKFPERSILKEKMFPPQNIQNLAPIHFQNSKVIMHIDMDCFFVSVGLRTRPHLKGFPVAVTHSKGRNSRPKRSGVDRNTEFNLYKQKQIKKLSKATGILNEDLEIETRVDNVADEGDEYGSMSEIASCSYEARAKGISIGMFMGAALKLCPELKTIPYDFDGYKEVAYTLYNTIAQYTLDIEAVSCDEMYVDCTELLKSMDVCVKDFATVIRMEIKSKTGCPCSTGFGGNRLQARLATKRAKPDGQFFLTTELVEDFMYHIKLKDLPGVGRQTALKLESLGHQTCGSLLSLSLASLKIHLGTKTGAQLYDQCRGRDPNPLTFLTVRKSVSAEVNYGIRFENYSQCIQFLKQLSIEVHTRMLQFKVVGKSITLKLMIRAEDAPVETAKFMGHGFCDVINKSVLLSVATNDANIISNEVITLIKKLKIDPKEMRGIGIQVTKLESTVNIKSRGAISKFLSNIKDNAFENKPNGENRIKSHNRDESELNLRKPELPITPKKCNAVSPFKKSPILGSLKTSPGKKRGRPAKKLTLKASSKNLISKFLQGADLESGLSSKYTIIKQEKVNQNAKENVIEEPQGLLSLPWEKIRELLRAWLESGQTPLPCDIDLISTYLREMVINRRIDKLNILLNFFRRRTAEMNSSDWLNVYDNVMENVQNAMLAVYGKKLICEL